MLTRGHKLLTKELVAQLPALYEQDGKGDDAIVYAHYFSPWSSWDWYAMEYDGADTFFGYVRGFEEELGYFALSELSETVMEVFGTPTLAIERDLSWEPKTLRQVKELARYGETVNGVRLPVSDVTG